MWDSEIDGSVSFIAYLRQPNNCTTADDVSVQIFNKAELVDLAESIARAKAKIETELALLDAPRAICLGGVESVK